MKNKKSIKSPFTLTLLISIIFMVLISYIFILIISDDDGIRPEPEPAFETEPDNEPDSIHDNEPDAGIYNDDLDDLQIYDTVSTGQASPPADTITVTVIDSRTDGPGSLHIGEGYLELFSALNEEAASHNCAAVSLVVYDGHAGLFYPYQYGYADISTQREVDINTKFRSASLSKLVVAVCAMILVDDGKLDLDEDISVYLGYDVKNPDFPNTPITTRMLLQHTSSIYDSTSFNDSLMGRARASTQNLLSGSSPYWDRRPGTAFQYSNFGYAIIGAICELISDLKLDVLAKEILFDPMDIDASFLAAALNDTSNIVVLYNPGHSIARSVRDQLDNNRTGALGQDQHLAQGSLMISAFDYAKILAMLGNGGVFLDKVILTPESVSEMHRADVTGNEYMQGLSTRFSDDGSFMPDLNFYWHTGSAYGVYAQYMYVESTGTDEGIAGAGASRGVVVITTGANSERAANGMINVCTHLAQIAWPGLGFDS